LNDKKPLKFLNLQTNEEDFRERFTTERPINVRIIKESNIRKNAQINLNEKHHINRLKNTFCIPLELQTQKYE